MRPVLRLALLALVLALAAPTAALATESSPVPDPETDTVDSSEEPAPVVTPSEATESEEPVVGGEPEGNEPAAPEPAGEPPADEPPAHERGAARFDRAAPPPVPAVLPGASDLLTAVVVAQVAPDLDCSDFRFQEDAQIHYEADTSDPSGLDGPKGRGYTGAPGVACENLPSRGASGLASVASAVAPVPVPLPPLPIVEEFVPAVVAPAVAELLAATGLPAPALAGAAAALLVAGVLLLLTARRRTG